MNDDLLERLGRGCNCGRCKLDLCCCAAMEEAKAEIEKLRQALVWADLKIRSLPHTDQSDVEPIRAALGETK